MPGGGNRETKESAVLVAGNDTALIVEAKIDPGALSLAWNGIEQLDLETFFDRYAVAWRRPVFINGRSFFKFLGFRYKRLNGLTARFPI